MNGEWMLKELPGAKFNKNRPNEKGHIAKCMVEITRQAIELLCRNNATIIDDIIDNVCSSLKLSKKEHVEVRAGDNGVNALLTNTYI